MVVSRHDDDGRNVTNGGMCFSNFYEFVNFEMWREFWKWAIHKYTNPQTYIYLWFVDLWKFWECSIVLRSFIYIPNCQGTKHIFYMQLLRDYVPLLTYLFLYYDNRQEIDFDLYWLEDMKHKVN